MERLRRSLGRGSSGGTEPGSTIVPGLADGFGFGRDGSSVSLLREPKMIPPRDGRLAPSRPPSVRNGTPRQKGFRGRVSPKLDATSRRGVGNPKEGSA